MSDERRGADSPAWGRVGPEDPTADPATMPAMDLRRGRPGDGVESSGAHAAGVPDPDGTHTAGRGRAADETDPGMRAGASDATTEVVPVGDADEGRPHADETPTAKRTIPNSRIGGLWAALILSAVVLIFLLVFIVQNTTPVQINFFWLTGTLPTGVALLFAAIAGMLLIAVPGTARIMQLRRQARRG